MVIDKERGMGCCRPTKNCAQVNTLVLSLVCFVFLAIFAFYSAGISSLSGPILVATTEAGIEETRKDHSEWIHHFKNAISESFRRKFKQKDKPKELVRDASEAQKSGRDRELAQCPEKPKELVGMIQPVLDPVNISTVQSKYPEVDKGGNYQSKDCKARERLAVIIPCRNRTQHLHILLNNLLGLLIKQKLHFTIFVIDQDLPTTFNRGMLFNVGYLEAMKRGQYDCFIFHDVDMIPTNDNCLYRCSHNPRHFLSGVSKWHYGLPYRGYYGGVVAFTRDQYNTINGDSNLYFGWGGEDDDLRARILNKGYSLVRYPKYIGRYDTISHKRDSGNKANPARFKLVNTAKARQDIEGLNTTHYTVTEAVEEQLFTKVKVYINMTQMIRTAPDWDWPLVKVLLKDALAFDEEIRRKPLKPQASFEKPIK